MNVEILTPKLRVDAELSFADISHSVVEMQEFLEPYGMGNSQPIFAARMVTPAARRACSTRNISGWIFALGIGLCMAIFFRGAEESLPQPPWDIAFTVERDEFNGYVQAQMQIVALRSAACRT